MNALTSLLHDENGATLVEYGIIVALIAVVCVGILTTLGKSLIAMFTNVNADL